MARVTFITGNQNKAAYLAKYLGLDVDHQKVNLDEIQSTSVEEVIKHKVEQAYELTGEPVIVDDIAMGFDNLNGLPGPFIKFFVDQPEGLSKLCRMVDGLQNRRATATCSIGYYDGQTLRVFISSIHGEIAQQPAGKNGYGWDAIFCPNGYGGRTRAELNDEEYEEVYRQIRPLSELKEFLTGLES